MVGEGSSSPASRRITSSRVVAGSSRNTNVACAADSRATTQAMDCGVSSASKSRHSSAVQSSSIRNSRCPSTASPCHVAVRSPVASIAHGRLGVARGSRGTGGAGLAKGPAPAGDATADVGVTEGADRGGGVGVATARTGVVAAVADGSDADAAPALAGDVANCVTAAGTSAFNNWAARLISSGRSSRSCRLRSRAERSRERRSAPASARSDRRGERGGSFSAACRRRRRQTHAGRPSNATPRAPQAGQPVKEPRFPPRGMSHPRPGKPLSTGSLKSTSTEVSTGSPDSVVGLRRWTICSTRELTSARVGAGLLEPSAGAPVRRRGASVRVTFAGTSTTTSYGRRSPGGLASLISDVGCTLEGEPAGPPRLGRRATWGESDVETRSTRMRTPGIQASCWLNSCCNWAAGLIGSPCGAGGSNVSGGARRGSAVSTSSTSAFACVTRAAAVACGRVRRAALPRDGWRNKSPRASPSAASSRRFPPRLRFAGSGVSSASPRTQRAPSGPFTRKVTSSGPASPNALTMAIWNDSASSCETSRPARGVTPSTTVVRCSWPKLRRRLRFQTSFAVATLGSD